MRGAGSFVTWDVPAAKDGKNAGSITQTKGPMAWDRPLAWGSR